MTLAHQSQVWPVRSLSQSLFWEFVIHSQCVEELKLLFFLGTRINYKQEKLGISASILYLSLL
jgi:hypothetical protein